MQWQKKNGVYHCRHWRIKRQPKSFSLSRVVGEQEILKTFIGDFDRLYKAKQVAAMIEAG